MTWLKFKHGTLKKQYNVTTILPLPRPSVLSPKGIIAPHKCFNKYSQQFIEWANGFLQQEDSSSQFIFSNAHYLFDKDLWR